MPPARGRLSGRALAGIAVVAGIAGIGLGAFALLGAGNASLPADARPIPLVSEVPTGVTVVSRDAEEDEPVRVPPPAPVAQGADRAAGFAVELGAALSFGELSARFARIANLNAEAEFDRLEPRATLKDTDTGLEARLLVGPFGTAGAAETTCASIALPAGIECRVVPFEGELISRQ